MTLEEQNAALQPGPCVMCGATDYSLSMGGPTICPSCDCGNFGIAKVTQQRDAIVALREENRLLREGAAHVVAALDAAVQLTELLIMFLPDGQPLPPQLGACKAKLDDAMAAIGVRK